MTSVDRLFKATWRVSNVLLNIAFLSTNCVPESFSEAEII